MITETVERGTTMDKTSLSCTFSIAYPSDFNRIATVREFIIKHGNKSASIAYKCGRRDVIEKVLEALMINHTIINTYMSLADDLACAAVDNNDIDVVRRLRTVMRLVVPLTHENYAIFNELIESYDTPTDVIHKHLLTTGKFTGLTAHEILDIQHASKNTDEASENTEEVNIIVEDFMNYAIRLSRGQLEELLQQHPEFSQVEVSESYYDKEEGRTVNRTVREYMHTLSHYETLEDYVRYIESTTIIPMRSYRQYTLEMTELRLPRSDPLWNDKIESLKEYRDYIVRTIPEHIELFIERSAQADYVRIDHIKTEEEMNIVNKLGLYVLVNIEALDNPLVLRANRLRIYLYNMVATVCTIPLKIIEYLLDHLHNSTGNQFIRFQGNICVISPRSKSEDIAEYMDKIRAGAVIIYDSTDEMMTVHLAKYLHQYLGSSELKVHHTIWYEMRRYAPIDTIINCVPLSEQALVSCMLKD